MKTKNELIDEVLRLDGERTQGDWHRRENTNGATNLYLQADGKTIADFRYKNGYKDLAFSSRAPDMARLIRDLKAQRDMAVEALEGVLGCRSYDEHGEFHGWRISAGASHGGGLTQRAVKADETLAKIKSGEWL